MTTGRINQVAVLITAQCSSILQVTAKQTCTGPSFNDTSLTTSDVMGSWHLLAVVVIVKLTAIAHHEWLCDLSCKGPHGHTQARPDCTTTD